jgi:hypothetical protein
VVAFFECCLFVGLLGPSCRSGRINKQWGPQLKSWYVTIKGGGDYGTYQVEKIARLPGRIQACRSYIYDEKQLRVQFVHVLFRNEKLVSATDGHAKTCKIKN